MGAPVVSQILGGDVRHAGVRARLYVRVVGPKRTEFDYWVVGFRLFSLFVFLQRYSWCQMRLSVEYRGRTHFARAWRWWRAVPPAIYTKDQPHD